MSIDDTFHIEVVGSNYTPILQVVRYVTRLRCSLRLQYYQLTSSRVKKGSLGSKIYMKVKQTNKQTSKQQKNNNKQI